MVALALSGLVYRNRWLFTVVPAKHNRQMYGFITIPQGEQWNVCMTNGKLRTVTGPDVVRIWGATLLQLQLFTASHIQYLAIDYVNGRSEIKAGPAHVYMDRSIHKNVKVV